MEALIWGAGAVFGTIIGYLLGKHHERGDWNKLIRSGKLPRPSNPYIVAEKEPEYFRKNYSKFL